MYRHNQRQTEFEDFVLPFSGKLRSDNRWVKLAKFIPWVNWVGYIIGGDFGQGKRHSACRGSCVN